MAMVHALEQATNAHDLEALVGCFTADYGTRRRCTRRGASAAASRCAATGRQIFAGVPDLRRRVLSARRRRAPGLERVGDVRHAVATAPRT